MRDFFVSILVTGLMIALVVFIISLVRPRIKFNQRLFRTDDRKRLSTYYSGIIIVILILITLIAPPSTSKEQSDSIANSNDISESKEAASDEPQSEKLQLSNLYQVVKIVDGDTIDVNIEGKTERLRLIGVDTPEIVDPRKPVQCFGKEASNKAKEWLDGKKVRLESDISQGDKDKYGRLLRYVYMEDGTMYNKLIIAEGYAHEYTYNTPYKYQDEFKQAQKDAETSRKGLWSSSTCNGDTNQSTQQSTQTEATPSYNQSQADDCDPNYSPCIPNVSHDLDCSDISTSVRVIGVDRHRFDRDGDGYGCESN